MISPLTDARYTIALEYCGCQEPRWVARFCGDWVGQDKYKSGAIMLCVAYADKREMEVLP